MEVSIEYVRGQRAGLLDCGALAGVVGRYGVFSLDTRLFLFTGVLGGFTTFSAFGLETVDLIRRGDYGVASAMSPLAPCAAWRRFGSQ
jgi:fluoride ion exporter CrcB/FEX